MVAIQSRKTVSVTHGKRGGVFDQLVTIPTSVGCDFKIRLSLDYKSVKTITEHHPFPLDFLYDKPLLVTVAFLQTLTIAQYKAIGRFLGINQYTEFDFRDIGTDGVR